MSVAGLTIEYSVGNSADQLSLQRMRVAFERLDSGLANFGPFVWPGLSKALEEASLRQFSSEGEGPNRGAWAELTPRYRRWKEANYPGKPILERAGRLKAALTSSSSPFAARVTDGPIFDFGTRGVPYASFPQTGTANMASRPPFDFGPGFERNVQRIGAEAFRAAVKQSGVGEFAEVRT